MYELMITYVVVRGYLKSSIGYLEEKKTMLHKEYQD